MSDFGLTETNLDPSPSTSSWSLKYTLSDNMGRFLHMSQDALTTDPKRARLITAAQAANIRRLWIPAKALILRVGIGK